MSITQQSMCLFHTNNYLYIYYTNWQQHKCIRKCRIIHRSCTHKNLDTYGHVKRHRDLKIKRSLGVQSSIAQLLKKQVFVDSNYQINLITFLTFFLRKIQSPILSLSLPLAFLQGGWQRHQTFHLVRRSSLTTKTKVSYQAMTN